MKPDGSEATEVLSDTFCALAIAADGQKLVLATGGAWPGGRLVVFDMARSEIDTIPTTHTDILDVKFSKKCPQRIYFSSRSSGIYRIDVDGSNETLVDSSVRDCYFDLTSSDSVVTWGSKPAVHPSGHCTAYATSDDPQFFVGDIVIIAAETADTTYLHANPYKYAGVSFPYWSSDGKTLVITAFEWAEGDPLRPREAEIWALEQPLN